MMPHCGAPPNGVEVAGHQFSDRTMPANTSRRVALAVLALAVVSLAQPAAAQPKVKSILFVGNSFTFGANSPLLRFHAHDVTDLNKAGFGGVPALFGIFAKEAGLSFEVSQETSPGKTLEWHYTERAPVLAGKWDVVILQGYSTLDPALPGDPRQHVVGAQHLASLFKAANPDAKIGLVSTWARADQVYKPTGHWYGKPIDVMAADLAASSVLALKAAPEISMVFPVGTAWGRAMREGIADPNPYDGIDYGKVNLWTWDQYHASTEGYYLEALVIFGEVTGVDPTTLGPLEAAANELGMSPVVTKALQTVAQEELVAARAAALPGPALVPPVTGSAPRP
jgi:hypothetical protein